MPLTAQELDAEVASSPRLYAAAFKSNIDRFKDVGAQNESRNLFYDVKVGELSHDVQSSPRKYASTFRKPSTKSSTVMPLNDLVYDIDHLNKSTIAKRVHDDHRNYSFNFTEPRFSAKINSLPEATYDINTLDKMDLVKAVQASPQKYSIMKSKTPRAEVETEVHGDYESKLHDLSYRLQKSPRRYAIMNSSSPRIHETHHAVPDAIYKLDALTKITIATSAQEKPGCKSVFLATGRKESKISYGASEKFYDVDCGNKKSIWKSTQSSGNPFFAIAKPFKFDTMKDENTPRSHYDLENCPIKPTVSCSIMMSPRRYSNLNSSTPRFSAAKPQPNIQAFYNLENCPRGEGSIAKRVQESPRRYFGAQSMQSRSLEKNDGALAEYQPEYGKYKSLSKSIQDSPATISSMRSSIPRFKVEKKTVISDDYEKLLRNPDQIDLKFQIQGNLVIKKLSDTQQMIVGRQAPVALQP
uniref:Uncharacterized protein n=1 Tax=Hanusia phi TaxID=3032 RepID=A0A7S0EVS7_9CRYP|mmetsp:Transcript_3191/g.7668  ORF Transcript_3191/g.7668 Transcript_3191/m.7668 type:complete len:469 (+) Transcript_3191:288-1694(+)